jgi:hypothetical protein
VLVAEPDGVADGLALPVLPFAPGDGLVDCAPVEPPPEPLPEPPPDPPPEPLEPPAAPPELGDPVGEDDVGEDDEGEDEGEEVGDDEVGDELGDGDGLEEDTGGATPGGTLPPDGRSCCQAQPTEPPAGTVSPPTP